MKDSELHKGVQLKPDTHRFENLFSAKPSMLPMDLLTRDEFRQGIFARDGHKCVICGGPAVDAHHVMERRLFAAEQEFGGYFLDNGASVCQRHHLEAERTTLSTEEIREVAGIDEAVLPLHLDPDQLYDKWGNPILPNGQRLKGELFFDESVQKVLGEGGVLPLFTHWVKYPRTFHLPWSAGIHEGDRVHETTDQWEGRKIVVTKKMDGENTTMYCDHIHARSVESGHHPSRSWVKQFHASIAHDIPSGWRICG